MREADLKPRNDLCVARERRWAVDQSFRFSHYMAALLFSLLHVN